MSKSKNKSKSKDKSPTSTSSSSKNAKQNPKEQTRKAPSTGLDEIDSLFAAKKQSSKQLQQQLAEEKEVAKLERKRRKEARLQEEAEEIALRGGGGAAAVASAGGKRKADATAPQSLHQKAQNLKSLTYTRQDIQQLNGDKQSSNEAKDKWATDGLGGVFNGEGYTGRRDDGGLRVFKAHLMNREGFGGSKDCPFDCDCCFI
mmetsp:Transcript_10371/g.22867  ORF Transcript_10371/g.22867 Transcript_10371/m.22867 type:complete len:202 (+) Transcript_10371:226-831(+)